MPHWPPGDCVYLYCRRMPQRFQDVDAEPFPEVYDIQRWRHEPFCPFWLSYRRHFVVPDDPRSLFSGGSSFFEAVSLPQVVTQLRRERLRASMDQRPGMGEAQGRVVKKRPDQNGDWQWPNGLSPTSYSKGQCRQVKYTWTCRICRL